MEAFLQKTSPELGQDVNFNSSDPGNGLCDYEEYGTLWLFGYKELLNWKDDIQWLFSPVTGKYPYPGDLWGIDESGNLIIAETKLCKTSRGQDPFIDFVEYEKKLGREGRRVLEKQSLFDRWQKLLKKELEYIERFSPSLQQGTYARIQYPGIVPYSSKRFAVWRWRHFYLSILIPIIKGNYQKLVQEYLKAREENPSATQHYFGILLASSDTQAKLSRKGLQNYEQLCAETDKGRVHLCNIQALCLDETVQLNSQIM